jgi:putative addiction module killer protein
LEVTPLEVEVYITEEGKQPFTEWLTSLKDRQGADKILLRIRRIQTGNLGDHKSITDGVFELRIDFGPGYRVYFGKVKNRVVLLLCGGDKSSQTTDIQRALQFWTDYGRKESG